MADWFGLAPGRDDFTVANNDDAALLFSRADLDERLSRVIKRAFRTATPPKMILWGDWGVGKTHTLRHLRWYIESDQELPGKCVYIELPDVAKKSSFQVAHAALMDAIGRPAVTEWVQQFNAFHTRDAEDRLREYSSSSDVALAFMTLLARGEVTQIAWEWLSGTKLAASDARSAGLPPLLDQSQTMAHVLKVLGMLSKEIDDKSLIFLIDEAEKMSGVEDSDAVNHWLNALRILSDPLTREVGVIIAASFRDRNDLPPQLIDGQIVSRIGESNIIELQSFDKTDVEGFVRSLFEIFVDPSKGGALHSAHESEADGEPMAHFPMTDPAVEAFAEFACREGGITTPRDVQRLLDEILNQAIDDERHIVDRAYVDSFVASYAA